MGWASFWAIFFTNASGHAGSNFSSAAVGHNRWKKIVLEKLSEKHLSAQRPGIKIQVFTF
jgi:hypothetical protein